jgi:hypothetical protein
MGRQLGRLGGGARAIYPQWIAPTWALDGDGYAYNTPELSANLLTNPGFDTDTIWNKGAGWSISGGVAVGATTNADLTEFSVAPTANEMFVLECTIVTRTSGGVRPSIGGVFGAEWQATGAASASSVRGADTLAGVRGVAFVGTIDNVILRRVLNDTAFAYQHAGAATQVGVRRQENDGLNNIQLRTNVDTPNNPQNYVAIIQAGNQAAPCRYALVKVVAGVATTLIANTTVTFVAGALVEIRRSGTTFSMWYNGSQLGTNQTINDAAILAGQYCGVGAYVPAVLLSEFQINGTKVPFRF